MIQKLHEKKLDSKSFGDLFQVDGIPLWHFFQGFINSSFLPEPFKPLWMIEKEIKSGVLPHQDGAKTKLSAFALKIGLLLNEKLKYGIARSSRKTPRQEKRDVLFVALTNQVSRKNGKIEFFEWGGVLKSLKRYRRIKPIILIGDPFSKNSLFKLRVYDLLIYHYTTPNIIKKSEQLAGGLNHKWRFLDEKSKRKLFTIRGRDYWKFFERNMDILFSKEFLSMLVMYYLTSKEILLKHDIKVIYLTSFTNFYDLSLLAAARKLGRKVVYSSHGYTRGTVGGWKLLENVVFAAGGEEHKKELVKSGIKKENIVVTGFPFLDEVAHRRKKKLGGAKKTVSLLTTTILESKFMNKERYFKLIMEAMTQLKRVPEIEKIIIKLHPAEKYRSEYEKIIRSLGLNNVEIVQTPGRGPLYSVISSSDLLVGFGSTAVLEGLLFDKDAIHLKQLESRPVFEFESATYSVKRMDELADAVKSLLNDKKVKRNLKQRRAKYLQRAFYKVDGGASGRVAKLIASLVKEMKKNRG